MGFKRNWSALVVAMVLALALVVLASGAFVGGSAAQKRDLSGLSAVDRLRTAAPGVRVFEVGSRVSRVYGVPFASGTSPERAAIGFVEEYGQIFQPGDSSLEFGGTQSIMDGKFTAVYFRQMAMGVPVYKGYLTVLVKNQAGSPVVLASSSVQTVEIERSLGQISANQAVQSVRAKDRALKAESKPQMFAWPGETTTRYAWSFMVGNGDLAKPRRYTVFVDAMNGDVLEWRDEVYTVDVTGSVKGWATPGFLPNQAGNPAALENLVDVTARVVAGNSTRTNSLGNFTIPHGGAAAVDVQSLLVGSWANVLNDAGAEELLTLNVTPPGPANFVFNAVPTEFVQAQVDGFTQTQAIHNFAKAINGAYPGIDIAIPVNVNINSTCNAFYSASTINFYRAGGGCPNTAYSSVVHHEYGHFIIDMGHPAPTGDYHEGMADVTAAFMANDPCLGRDFSGVGTGCLRSTYNSVMHPCSGGVHLCGQVLSGAFWLTKDQLDVTMGAGPALTYARSLYLNSILLNPPDINPGVTIDVLTLDDDDANLGNGTPHYDEIASGFGAKNLDAPPILWLTFTPVNVPGEFVQQPLLNPLVPVHLSIQSNVGVLNPSTVRLVSRQNAGSWQERQMFQLSPSTPFRSFLFSPPAGTAIEWYVKAQDTNGNEMRWPSGDPNVTMFGLGLTTILTDTFETDLGWTAVNENLATGAWTRADPNGTTLNGPANPEDDSSDVGALCAFTGQGSVAGPVGEADVDGGPARIVSPVFDLAGTNGVIDFATWFYNDDGDDSLVIEISNDGGTNWTVAKTILFTGSENSWLTTKLYARNHVTTTSTMRLRFSTSDNPNNSITEAAIDDFRVRRF